MPALPSGAPRKTLSPFDGAALVVGIVVGAGIFKTPGLVAGQVETATGVLLLWVAGGVISLVGALCYAELATAFPSAGGDYHFLRRAFGGPPAFFYAWARMTVIQTGSIAMMAFLLGDYLSGVYSFGPLSAAIYAAAAVAALTALNICGIRQGAWTQNLLSVSIVLGLAAVIVGGLLVAGSPGPWSAAAESPSAGGGSIGLAMIFVLLTYGGWNEAAYLSGEVKGPRGNIAKALFIGIGVITLVYLAVNLAFVAGLGRLAMGSSEVVAADLMRLVAGEGGAVFISLLIALAAVSTMNATIITGARSNFALGQDYRLFSLLGRWADRGSTPVNALIAQGAIALALIGLGAGARSGFVAMVEYTAPVFWLFFLLVGLAVFALRRKEPEAVRPFRIPLYPLTPILFCAACAYMLRASLAYTGPGALVGVAVLLAGVPLLWLAGRRQELTICPIKETP
jgi:basic amino acid/polyamine antiporter, APA family